MSQELVDSLNAQLEAHKQSLGEHISINLNLRAHTILLEKKLKEEQDKMAALTEEIANKSTVQ